MELNKKLDGWILENDKLYEKVKPTILDNYAYQLYINNINTLLDNSYKIEQGGFIIRYKLYGNFKKYYIYAESILLIEKIKKIKSRKLN